MLASWCELRNDFRTFRIERFESVAVTQETFRDDVGKTIEDFVARPQEKLVQGTPDIKKAGRK